MLFIVPRKIVQIQQCPGKFLQQLKISLIRPFGAPSPERRRDNNQPLSFRERVAGGRVRG
jgi:hypothetical protein